MKTKKVAVPIADLQNRIATLAEGAAARRNFDLANALHYCARMCEALIEVTAVLHLQLTTEEMTVDQALSEAAYVLLITLSSDVTFAEFKDLEKGTPIAEMHA